ncbi:MAG: universal stress protein [Tissierellia bacterium]|nr:universal stress protein [Tissierellia bacterium]
MKILICVDGSKDSHRSLTQIKDFDILKGNDIHILNVISEERLSSNRAYNNYYTNLLTEYNVDESNELLDQSKKVLENENCKSITTNYLIGNPSKEIISYQKDNNIDLIIIASRGLGAFSRTLLGSVSNKVSNNATCSVLVVKDPNSKKHKH